MKNVFDPFDEKHQRRAKRRSSEQVLLDKQTKEYLYNSKIDSTLKEIMNFLDWPEVVQSFEILGCIKKGGLVGERQMRLNLTAAMARIGWVRASNPRSVDGRWATRAGRVNVFVKNGIKYDRKMLSERLHWASFG